jgi:hypothetical protein
MNAFEKVHRDRVLGSLTMFDRLIFKGHMSRLYVPGALPALLWSQGTPLTGFAAYVKGCTQALLDHAERMAAEAGHPAQRPDQRRDGPGDRRAGRDHRRAGVHPASGRAV